MSNIEIIHNCIYDAKIKAIVGLPDSHLHTLCKKVILENKIRYIQTVHESIAVGIATGFNLTGRKAIVIMENSGLRSACESIARLNLSHNLFSIYIISNRGEFGERNWWGISHNETMNTLLNLMRFRWAVVDSISNFRDSLDKCLSTFEANQCSVALILNNNFITEMES